MKKLFLYITFLLIIFIIAFSITEYFFYNHTKNNTKLTATEYIDNHDENEETEAMLIESKPFNQTQFAGNAYEKSHKKTNYIVTIKNGYIIVYENTIENIYEYTGIDAETIRINDEEMYKKLSDSIIFDTSEELFDFLESIAG